MSIIKLAEKLATKYKFAINAVDLEASIRRKIPVLWGYPNKLFPILKACADSGITNAKTLEEKKAYHGYKFCKELLNDIEYLQKNHLNIDVTELKLRLEKIVNTINNNKNIKFTPGGTPTEKDDIAASSVQFPHVAELIYALYPLRKKHDKKLRDESQAKARTGLSRILSFSLSLLEDLSQLELMEPEKFVNQPDPESEEETLPNRFDPQRAQLNTYDIIDFIRQHGSEYGISNTDDWATLFMNDPVLKEEMTTVINAINRGHYPRGAEDVRVRINEILSQHKEREARSNAHLFEDKE
jgi:hypothetical protein